MSFQIWVTVSEDQLQSVVDEHDCTIKEAKDKLREPAADAVDTYLEDL